MPKLFIFAIGGTGARVMKSLTMLLASGVKPMNRYEDFEIVPIIIDPHKSNEDLKRTLSLLDYYQKITYKVGNSNGFFGTRISTLDNLVSTQNRLAGSFSFNLQDVSNIKFKEYIDYNLLDESNRALADLLFSGKSIDQHGNQVDLLDVKMDIGFVGNPNIGSVVLNQIKYSEEFIEFASNFGENDRIFIISSIFGGTGAAGFPSLLKNIRDARNNNRIDSAGFLENSKIGAVTVLPYFNIEKNEESPIQKSDFISKTKSALTYYMDNVNSSVNAMYYLADDYSGKPYPNDPGNGGQKNNAHFIELAAALAVIDFLEIPSDELISESGRAVSPIVKEFGIKSDKTELNFGDFAEYTEKKLSMRLSQLALFKKYIDKQLMNSVEREPWSEDEPKIDRHFTNDSFYKSNLTEFLNAYREWLDEMSGNRRSFSPINFDAAIEKLVEGKKAETPWYSRKLDFKTIDDQLNRTAKKEGAGYNSAEEKFVALFFKATEEILKSKYGILTN